MKILILEDNDNRIIQFLKIFSYHETCVVKKSSEAVELLDDNFYDFLFLDHDLGGEVFVSTEYEDCGMRVVDYIVENNIKIPNIVIHSWNPLASKSMFNRLSDYKYDSVFIKRFGSFGEEILNINGD